MPEPINLAELRERAEHRGIVQREDGPVITFADWDDVLALIDLAEAAHDLVVAMNLPPDGQHDLEEGRLREALARFTFEAPA